MIFQGLKRWWQASPEERQRRLVAHERYLAKLAEDVRKQRARMAARRPSTLRENSIPLMGLIIFSYLWGSSFMSWWGGGG